ncbi:ribosome assembly factor SBDS [Candidatus Woesearchaeota archaeon]|nr:ribosome assembly factor SBDS [Candidatus Woesearchaeota archaeon]
MSSDHINVARYKRGSDVFEVVIDPEMAMRFKHGQGEIRDVVSYPKIFSDAKKGMLASELRMNAVFNTTDALQVAAEIVRKGDVALTAEYKAQLQEQKRKRIIDHIHRNAVDPKTNLPHPANRIESALEQAKVRIDEFKPVEQQLDDAIKALRPILPIKFVIKEIEVNISAALAPKAFPVLKQFGKVVREAWKEDGTWQGMVEIPGGLEHELYDKLNAACKGDVSAKVVRVRE